MITDADISKLKSTFATKKNLEKYATKDALEKLDVRTAEGFSDVQNQINEVKNDLKEVKSDLAEVKSDLAEVKSDLAEVKNHMITMEDHIMGALNTLTNENKVTANYRPKIENHEQRITKVEAVVFAN